MEALIENAFCSLFSVYSLSECTPTEVFKRYRKNFVIFLQRFLGAFFHFIALCGTNNSSQYILVILNDLQHFCHSSAYSENMPRKLYK